MIKRRTFIKSSVATAAAASLPGVGFGAAASPPLGVKPDENVLVFHVGNFLGRQHYLDETSPKNTPRRQQFMDWAKVSHHIMWRPNTGSPAGWQQGSALETTGPAISSSMTLAM